MSQITQFTNSNVPGSPVQTLTGNVGGPVSPLLGNINVVGDNVTILASGNPATHTITLSTTGISVFLYTAVNTTPYVVLTTDDFIGVDVSGGPITIELPNAPTTGRIFYIKDATGFAAIGNAITVTTVGGVVLIDAAATFTMNTAYESIGVLFNGTQYLIF